MAATRKGERTGSEEACIKPCFEQEQQMGQTVLQNDVTEAGYGCQACGMRPQGCGACIPGPRVKGRWDPENAETIDVPEIPTYRPSEAEFREGLHSFVERVRPDAEKYGAIRVVPPESKRAAVGEPATKFKTRVQAINELQSRPPGPYGHNRKERKKRKRAHPPEGDDDRGESSGEERHEPYGTPYGFPDGPTLTVSELREYADYFMRWHFRDERGNPPRKLTVRQLEGEFWRIVERHDEDEPVEVIYGADIPTNEAGSCFQGANDESDQEPPIEQWSVQATNADALSLVRHTKGATGISKPWLYFGSALTAFCWHVEDHHLFSVNCLTAGAPKVWYVVPAEYGKEFEQAMRKHLGTLFDYQPDLLQSLVTHLSPEKLKGEGVPVFRAVQEAGNYIITFPFAYHGGFNTSYNVAEAVNFAPPSWLAFGASACERYASLGRRPTVSFDRLLMALAIACEERKAPRGAAIAMAPVLARRVRKEAASRKSALEEHASGGISLMSSGRDSPDLEDTRCTVCGRDCHLSGVICGCMPWRPTCGRHTRCKCPTKRRRLLVRCAHSELRALAARITSLAHEEEKKDPGAKRFVIPGDFSIRLDPGVPDDSPDDLLDAVEASLSHGDSVPSLSTLVASDDAVGPGLGRGFSRRASKSRILSQPEQASSRRRGRRGVAPPGW